MATGGQSPEEERKLCDDLLHFRLSTEDEEESLEFRYDDWEMGIINYHNVMKFRRAMCIKFIVAIFSQFTMKLWNFDMSCQYALLGPIHTEWMRKR